MTKITLTTAALDAVHLIKFNLSVDYSLMRQNSPRPHSVPFRRSHTKSELDDPIKGYKNFPDIKKPSADVCYINHMVSLYSLVKDNMKEFENRYFTHTFGLSSQLPHKGES
mgnify:CR=1 FL=1